MKIEPTGNISELNDIFLKETGQGVTPKDAQALQAEGVPQKPDFPLLLFLAALFKDVLDGLDLTGVGVVITTILSLIIGAVIFLWLLGKVGFIQKRILRWAWGRYIGVMLIESIPFLKLIPTTALFVWFAHHKEDKLVKLAFSALEKAYGKFS
ncbi:MAG: hypothetical protein G01um101472_580 [Parcubacteria group bacterium Gr01-1014_72]|nr:MAG: hypothetical protein G01um101472_580 [Parcubacteria group bacterium Gr01-1014_72]